MRSTHPRRTLQSPQHINLSSGPSMEKMFLQSRKSSLIGNCKNKYRWKRKTIELLPRDKDWIK